MTYERRNTLEKPYASKTFIRLLVEEESILRKKGMKEEADIVHKARTIIVDDQRVIKAEWLVHLLGDDGLQRLIRQMGGGMDCPYCHQFIIDEMNFCSNCGHQLKPLLAEVEKVAEVMNEDSSAESSPEEVQGESTQPPVQDPCG